MMLISGLLVISLAYTYADLGECGVSIEHVTTVHRGEDVNKGVWPWVVPIFKRTFNGSEFHCGGVLVSKTHIITAAHCIHGVVSEPKLKREDLIVYPGMFKLDVIDADTQSRNLSEIIIHPQYRVMSKAQDSDIAVLVMSRPVNYTNVVKPACLWNPVASSNRGTVTGAVIGWGKTEQDVRSETPKLARMDIVSNDVCLNSHRVFRDSGIVTNKTICAGDRNGRGPCNGDSGGGLFITQTIPSIGERFIVRGIISKSIINLSTSSCNLYQYAVMTNVYKFTSWLRCVIPVENDIPMVKLNRKFYYFSDTNTRLPWHSANDFCQALGLQLASIEELTENVALSSYAREKLAGQSSTFWVGGNSEADNSTWKWQGVDQDLTLFNWAQGEPGGNERCLGLNPRDGYFNWHDVPCQVPFQFICEKEDTCPGL